MLRRRQVLSAATGATVSAALGLSGAPVAQAQDKVTRLVLPNATGSGVDTIARSAQGALAKALGTAVVVDNQPGAGGVVGLTTLSRAAPDGHTLSIVSNNVVIFPSVIKQLPFNMPGDFTPIAICGYTPLVLVVNAKVPAKNAKEFNELLKAKGSGMFYASGGNGTILHLATAMYLNEVSASALHVPYKGVGPMLTDLIGGQVEFASVALPSVQQYLKSGALRAIGVASPQRLAAAPDIATFAEQGLARYQVEAWFAVLGPKGMSASEVKRVNEAVVTAYAQPEVKEAMTRQGNVINISTADYAQSFFRTELNKYATAVKNAGLTAQ